LTRIETQITEPHGFGRIKNKLEKQKMDNKRKKQLDEISAQADANVEVWGHQPLATLGLVASEEMGEVCQAILQWEHERGQKSRIFEEARDLAAVCLQILNHEK
jgi:NTP pyrophosphatase (non-canonical NTP hydrolase)